MIPKIVKQALPGATNLVKPPPVRPSYGGVGAVVQTAHPQRSFSAGQTAPPGIKPMTTDQPDAPRARESSGSPGMPPVVKKVLDDVRRIDPGGSRETRSQQLAELAGRHGGELQACAENPTQSGRDEFLARTVKTTLLHMPRILGGWTGGGSGGLERERRAYEKIIQDRRAVFGVLKEQSPRQAAVLASLVPPDLRDQYGIRMSGKEMAALGIEDKGPYLSETQMLMLCDYTASDTGSFHLYRSVDVLKQQLGGRASEPFQVHIKDDVQALRGAVGTLAQNPGSTVKGDLYKAVELDSPYLRNGLASLCESGKTFPQGTATSATSDPKSSYLHTDPNRKAEIVFTNGEGLDVAPFHDSITIGHERGAVGQAEVLLKPGVEYRGAGTRTGVLLDSSTGGEVPYVRYLFTARPGGDNKGPA
ncbi:MAG: hypothetical protein AB7P37_02180 [Ramlibacter sp.]